MSEKTTVSGSVSVHDCKERVALELLQIIRASETSGVTKNRAYYLRLMAECISVVNGESPGGVSVSDETLRTAGGQGIPPGYKEID